MKKISIVIPAYNEGARIRACLAAIGKELERHGQEPIEVIVVNNASTDNTVEAAQELPFVRVVDEPHKGIVWARRAGFLASSGELVANIDADTLMPTGWLTTVLDEFGRDPDLLALSGPYIYYDISIIERFLVRIFYTGGFLIDQFNRLFLGRNSMLQGGNYVVRRQALEQVGGFDTSIEFYGEDIDIGRRIGKIGRIKWTFGLPMYSSGRRFRQEGMIRSGVRYLLNFFSTTFLGHPVTSEHVDVRPEETVLPVDAPSDKRKSVRRSAEVS